MYRSDVIAAIATASGNAGVGVVRVSGKGCFDLLPKLFVASGGEKEFQPNRMYFGTVLADGFNDAGFAVCFFAPHSYTGEDSFELQCHGGGEIMRGVLRACVKAGARLAEAGEYSKRAFLNGKMDLTAAEALANMITAQSRAEVTAFESQTLGSLRNKIKKIQDVLKDIISYVEVMLDYPEEDIPEKKRDELSFETSEVARELCSLVGTYGNGRKLKSGVTVALIGRTNAGKSSLLNAIIDEERAIVTDISGTTRDVVEAEREINGVRFIFCDTAGIRETTDEIEKIGISRSVKQAKSADLILLVREYKDEKPTELESLYLGKPYFEVMTKIDLRGRVGGTKADGDDVKYYVSSKTGEGIGELLDGIYRKSCATLDLSGPIIMQERQYGALSGALAVLNCVDFGEEYDKIAFDLRDAWQRLGEVTGETASEDIIDNIFSKFCLGK